MRVYAINQRDEVIELSFTSEDRADEEFNRVLFSNNKTNIVTGVIDDDAGKRHVVNVTCGYSKNRSDMVYQAVYATSEPKFGGLGVRMT